MTPKATRDELLSIKVLSEQRWAYARRLEHLSYHEMRVLVSAAPADGGLGYDISEHRLKGLVTSYRDAMRETLQADIEEQRDRELADLDLQHRALVAMLGSIDHAETAKMRAEVAVKGDISLAEVASQYPDVIVPVSTRNAVAILSQLRAVGESRRKLLGIDAPQQVKVDVVQHDAVLEELNAMLARAGRDPIETTT